MADAAVWITGSGPDKQLNFRLPTGGIGPVGPKGADGSNVLPTDTAIAAAVNNGASATKAALNAAILDKIKTDGLPKWKPATAYTLGQAVLNPAGETVFALAAFTSGATYDAAKWTSGGLLTGKFPMRNYSALAGKYNAGTVSRLKWVTFGDSMAQGIFERIYSNLRRAWGGSVAGAYFTGSSASTTTNATTGTVTENVADYDAWPTGLTSTFATGATRTYGVGGAAFTSDTIKVYYVKEATGGTFKLQVDGVDATGFTNVSANNGTLTMGIATLSVTRAAHTVTVVNLTGTVRIIGVGFEDSTISGIVPINVSKGGNGLNDAMSTATGRANFQAFLADVNPTVISTEMKEASSYYAASLDQLFTIFTNGAPAADVVTVATPAVGIGGDPTGDQALQNAQLFDAARKYGYMVFDAYSAFGPFVQAQAKGFFDGGENTHYNTNGKDFLAGLFARDLALYSRLGNAKASSQTTVVEEELVLGNNPAQRVLRWIADISTALDVTARLQRVMNYADSTGAVFAYLDSRNNAGAPSALPKYSQFGTGGMSGLSAANASKLEARRWASGNMNNTADFVARSFVATANTANISGAAAVDLGLGGVHTLTLTGNVTALTLTGLVASGQQFTIGFVQDGTGSRTLAGVTNSYRFAGGTTPTLTTTAGRRDYFTFVVDSGVAWEVSRAMNVG